MITGFQSLESAVELVKLFLKLVQLYVWPNLNETIPNPLYDLFTAGNIFTFIKYIVLEILLNFRLLYLLLIVLTHIPQVKLRNPSIFPDNDFPENRVDAITSFSAKAVYSNNYNINLSDCPIA
jgi:hypothetical protein